MMTVSSFIRISFEVVCARAYQVPKQCLEAQQINIMEQYPVLMPNTMQPLIGMEKCKREWTEKGRCLPIGANWC